MACACINCCQRGDWTRANGLVVEGETERKTWMRECLVGNSIIEFIGIEHCKAMALWEGGKINFVVCMKCKTDVFELVPMFLPEAFNIVESGMKWDVADAPVTDESARASSHNNDLDPKYDPDRKNKGGTYKG